MAQMTAVKEAVKDSLVGTDESTAKMSAQTKARFLSNAIKDPETGELSMGVEEFINAIAPTSEDFVSSIPASTNARGRALRQVDSGNPRE